MNEDEIDFSWAEEQIAASRVPVPVGRATMALLKVWATLDFPNDTQRDQAIDLFSQLAKNEAVVEENTGTWKPVQVGFMVQVGDTVRVRSDAFEGSTGRVHNGRVGRVLAKRSGDIIMRSTDGKTPHLDAAHYPPSSLELKVA